MPPSPLWGEGKGPPRAAAPTGDRQGQGGHTGPPLHGGGLVAHSSGPAGHLPPRGKVRRAATWGRPYGDPLPLPEARRVVASHTDGPSLSVGADVPIGPRPARPGGCALQGVHLRRGARCAPLQDGRQVAPSSGPAGHLPPRGKVRRHTGSFFVIARRAAGPTRQSVSPSKEKRIPTAPPGPRNDGAGAQCAPLQTAGTQKIIPNSSFLRRRKLHVPRFRLTAKARSFRCSDSPHATRFAGLARGPQILNFQFLIPHS